MLREAAISASNTAEDNALLTTSGANPSRAARGLAEQAYRAIRNAIQEGQLEAGQRVPELELCTWLKVSRTPIRRVRERLEGTAAALAARFADATEVHMLQAMLDLHSQWPDDPKVHARGNTVFHEHIYRAAHNRFLIKSLQDLHDSVVLLGRTTFAVPGRIPEALAEHRAIVAAIARRDEAEAEELARRHVRRGYELRLSAMVETARAGSQPAIDQAKGPLPR
jgi:DNA-binding GntR family transcriptional regulator